MKEINFTIEESAKGRLDKVIAENVADLTRSQVQSLIKKGQILVNDVPTTNRYQVKPNDQVIIKLPDPVAIDVQPEKMDLDIVYEDDDVIVVNKPQGMVVHPAPGHDHGTLVNGLLAHTPLATSVLKPRWNATRSVSKILAVEILKKKSYSNSNSSPVCPLITRLSTLHVFQCHSDNASPLTSVDLTTNIKLFALA
ncbi:S4 domain-containing protein [Pediococcus acidilactici]